MLAAGFMSEKLGEAVQRALARFQSLEARESKRRSAINGLLRLARDPRVRYARSEVVPARARESFLRDNRIKREMYIGCRENRLESSLLFAGRTLFLIRYRFLVSLCPRYDSVHRAIAKIYRWR